MHRAAVAGGDIAVRVQGRDGDAESDAGGSACGGADLEMAGGRRVDYYP